MISSVGKKNSPLPIQCYPPGRSKAVSANRPQKSAECVENYDAVVSGIGYIDQARTPNGYTARLP